MGSVWVTRATFSTNRRITVKKMILLSILCTLTASIAGCTWQPKITHGWPVWSDDGTAVAAVKHTFEEKQGVSNFYETRNHQVQVFTGDPVSGTTLSPVTGLLDGTVQDFYFMKSKGYYILGRNLGNETVGDDTHTTIRFDKISLTGQVTEIDEITAVSSVSCSPGSSSGFAEIMKVIPSWDGNFLGKFTMENSCSGLNLEISILDASDLSVVGGPWTLQTQSILPGGFAWNQSGVLMLGTSGSSPFGPPLYTGYEVGQNPQTLTGIDTDDFFPASSSSENNASGDTVEIDDITGEISIN